MLEKGKISAFQMAIMMFPTIIGTAVLSVPSITAEFAQNDLWLSPIWASPFGYLTVFIVYQLHQHYPEQTIIQYSNDIIGSVLGKILGIMILSYLLHTNGTIVRIYADFIVGSFLHHTPISVVITTITVVCAFAVREGIEVVGRASQLFLPFFIFPLFIMIIFLMPNLDINQIFPILEQGVLPSIKGAIAPQAWFGEYLLISFLLPFLHNREKGLKWSVYSVTAVMLMMVLTNLLTLFFLGEYVGDTLYPILRAARFISIANFFENLESIVMAIWVMGAFVKISVFFYATALGTAQWLNMTDYRPIVWPLGFFTVIFSFWDLPNSMELGYYNTFIWPFYGLFIQTLIPLALLLIAFIQKRKVKKSLF